MRTIQLLKKTATALAIAALAFTGCDNGNGGNGDGDGSDGGNTGSITNATIAGVWPDYIGDHSITITMTGVGGVAVVSSFEPNLVNHPLKFRDIGIGNEVIRIGAGPKVAKRDSETGLPYAWVWECTYYEFDSKKWIPATLTYDTVFEDNPDMNVGIILELYSEDPFMHEQFHRGRQYN